MSWVTLLFVLWLVPPAAVVAGDSVFTDSDTAVIPATLSTLFLSRYSKR